MWSASSAVSLAIKLIIEVESGKELMEIAMKEVPSLIISDNRMPGLWGSAALRNLMPLLPEARAILLSGDNPNDLDVPEDVQIICKESGNWVGDLAKAVRKAIRVE